jgi:maleate isomerase
MPSLPALQAVQDAFDIPVVSASAATVWSILRSLDLEPVVPNAGALLAGGAV